MAINIIEGFYLGSSTPIDSRFVVASATDRTSIVYKYDGLKVFQTDTRETWVWNSGTSTWDLEGSSNTSGSGTQNFVTKWLSSTVLGTSSLFATGSNVGINTVNPLATLQINGINNPVVIDNGPGGAIVGYNYYYSGGDQYFSVVQGSARILMDSTGIISFAVRNPGSVNSTPYSYLGLNAGGFNFLFNPDNGNYLGGKTIFGPVTFPYTSTYGDLVFVNGSFRTNQSVSKNVKFLTWSGPLSPSFISNNYTITNTDHEITIGSTNNTQFNVTLPTPSTNNQGREIVISLVSTSNPLSQFTLSGGSIIDLDGSGFSSAVKVGDTIRLISYGGANIPFWKVAEIIKPFSVTQTAITNNQNYIMNTLVPARTWTTIPNYPTTGTALTLGPIYVYVFDSAVGGQYYHFSAMTAVYNLSASPTYGAGRAKFIFQITSNRYYNEPFIYLTKDSVGQVTLSGGVLTITNVPSSYVKNSAGTLGVDAYTEGNSVGNFLIWRIATLASTYRPNIYQNNISVKISMYIDANINQTVDGYLVINSDGNVYIQFKVPSDATLSVGMEVYIPPISWYV